MSAIPVVYPLTADELVAQAWMSNGHAGGVCYGEDGVRRVDVALLADRVIALEPKMTDSHKDLFRQVFIEVWPKVGCIVQGDVSPVDWSQFRAEGLNFFFNHIFQIARSGKPAARSSDKFVKDGDAVAYPSELAAMKARPYDFGIPRIPGLIVSQIQDLVITHRQLALHVEFAPLIAAVFCASKMPRSIINGQHMPLAGSRPFLSRLVAVISSRCPDNMHDDRFIPYLRWLLETQDPPADDYGVCVVG